MARVSVFRFGMVMALAASAWTQSAQQADVPTLHATAKLVIVDVVVRDGQHRPIHGLKQGDFTLLEDGKVQAIKSFEEFSNTEPVKVQPVPKLPPGVFTNVTPAPGLGPLNILLFDNLDTQPKDFAVVRAGLLKFIDKARPGTRMALFEISDKLHLRQGFTDDHDKLREALLKSQPRTIRMNEPPPGLEKRKADPQLGPHDTIQAINAWRDDAEAMREFARYGAGMPGRKNLLWFSGYFPLYFLTRPPPCAPPFAPACDSAVVREFRQAADMLAASQVAVYPVDARGLTVSVDFDQTTNQQEMGAMTGGRAFTDENNLDEITAAAIDDGSNYYTIAYSPSDMRWNGDYRKIKVQVNREGLELSYRQGFYADDPNAPVKVVSRPADKSAHVGAEASAMGTAMKSATEYGAPNATQIPFLVQLKPASETVETALAVGNHAPTDVKGPYRRYEVNLDVDPHAVAGEGAKGTQQAMLEFVTFVYETDARLVNTVGMTLKADIPAEALVAGSKERVPAHEEISVPVKGDYFLRIVVHDLATDHVGSLEIPVSEVGK